ncbi:inducible metalloproteinase inhibitor protein-like [Spodoptera litura]|uniref:Inducible metalloproteinase inhibitor protein-like n=1 Tax=Spodoptera litura TaxID=69820 RepID=A0A9J7DUY1_SPOLT|nr:inducible metalloproteinase inhibitor protein-like [Spodoptera litura]
MWRCAVLLSICWVGLAAARAYMDCGPNEIFNSCVDECPPEKACATRIEGVFCVGFPILCAPKCACKEGYYRRFEDGESECISDEECGPTCDPDEKYTECANHVDDSCTAMGSPKPNSTEPCVPGCVCNEGLFRLYNNGPCLPRRYCQELRHAPE